MPDILTASSVMVGSVFILVCLCRQSKPVFFRNKTFKANSPNLTNSALLIIHLVWNNLTPFLMISNSFFMTSNLAWMTSNLA